MQARRSRSSGAGLIAQTDHDAVPLQTTDGPEGIAGTAVGFDIGLGVEQPPQHPVAISFLKLTIPAPGTAGHERNHFVHRPKARQLAVAAMPVTRVLEVSKSYVRGHFAS